MFVNVHIQIHGTVKMYAGRTKTPCGPHAAYRPYFVHPGVNTSHQVLGKYTSCLSNAKLTSTLLCLCFMAGTAISIRWMPASDWCQMLISVIRHIYMCCAKDYNLSRWQIVCHFQSAGAKHHWFLKMSGPNYNKFRQDIGQILALPEFK